VAALGWLMATIIAPVAAFAAPTPAPPSTPAPQRGPNIALSPSAVPQVQQVPVTPSPSATRVPTSTATPTPDPTPTGTPTATQTPAPDRSPALAPSPSPSPEQGSDTAATDEENSDGVEASVDWRAFVPTDVGDHLATMDRAARDSNCGVPWQLLAAIARVESDFGRNMATSSAGAIGYGQFLPSSWQAFGSQGNAYDYRDALPAIALYLCQSGLARDPRVALFAYNHADWYVDMVLDLAVRYDRLAPGGPIPAVLGVGPAQQDATPMRYADGRDLHLQNRARTATSNVHWLGVPWRGRTPGQSISTATLDATTLSMLRLAQGGRGDVAPLAEPASSENLSPLSDAAWDAGLLALPEAGPQWTVSQLRQHLDQGQAVVVFVGSHGLPGHPSEENIGEQPLLLVGSTADGFVYSDPSYSSSLGYGLQIGETDLLTAWDAAARPRQALAFTPRPRPPARQSHVAEPEAPEPIARLVATSTPLPVVARPTVQPTSTQLMVLTPATLALAPAEPEGDVIVAESRPASASDWSWIALVGIGLISLGTVVIRRLRARRSS
jgi:hypothetical protein